MKARPGNDLAIQAAAVALANWRYGLDPNAMDEAAKAELVELAVIAVDAAYPVLDAAIREDLTA